MSRVVVETRKAYVIDIGGKKRRFWTEAAAYYKLAASLLGRKYLGPLKAAETHGDVDDFQAELLDMTVEQAQRRAERGMYLFHSEGDRYSGEPESYFDTDRWQLYVRRVATKMRAMDKIAAVTLDRCEARKVGR